MKYDFLLRLRHGDKCEKTGNYHGDIIVDHVGCSASGWFPAAEHAKQTADAYGKMFSGAKDFHLLVKLKDGKGTFYTYELGDLKLCRELESMPPFKKE